MLQAGSGAAFGQTGAAGAALGVMAPGALVEGEDFISDGPPKTFTWAPLGLPGLVTAASAGALSASPATTQTVPSRPARTRPLRVAFFMFPPVGHRASAA